MNTKCCQCCAMPMGDGTDVYGTNLNGRSELLCQDLLQKMIY